MIKSGLKNPKKGLEYLILGRQKYDVLNNLATHSCITIKDAKTPLESCMIQPTDIHEHLATLHMLTIELKLKSILELGTRTGESTIALLQAAKEINGKVTSLDIDPCLEAKKLVNSVGLEKYWTFIQTDDLKIEWNEPIDHLFMDSSHTYEQTMMEFKKFEPFVRAGGIITLHDIVSCSPVLLAIRDYINERDDIRFYKYYNNNGLGILKKTGNSK